MNNNYQTIIKQLGKNRVKLNEPMSEHTTFRIGGPADLYYEANTEDEIINIVKLAREVFAPFLIIGGGSNLLVSDDGYRGIVIKVQSSKLKVQSYGLKFKVIADVGVLISMLMSELVKNSLTGLEFMAGIPGTVGATVACNAGAWQRSLSEHVLRVKVLTTNGEVMWLDKSECKFDYRESRFKNGSEVILVVELLLIKGDQAEINRTITKNIQKRNSLPKEPSAGCIFINPKPLKAGQMIDECGLKGQQIGGAKISEKHANFIVNVGGAKAKDVVALINLAREKVKEKFSVDIKEEIVRIGEF